MGCRGRRDDFGFCGGQPGASAGGGPSPGSSKPRRTYQVRCGALGSHPGAFRTTQPQCLRRVRGCLADDGIVFIDVPNECSLWTRVGNAYFHLRGRDSATNLSPTFPPFHVVGFCPSSLRRMLHSCGLSVESLRTERWSNALPPRRGLLANVERLGSSAILNRGTDLGDGGGITCWARAASGS